MFLDTDDILAESLINRYMVRREIEGVFDMNNEEYRMVSIKVWKKDELCCLQSMEELKGKMLLFSHLPDQPETAAWLKPLDISWAYDQLHMVTWFS